MFSRLQGNDMIYDFTSIDVIDIGPGYKYDDFSDILSNATQYSGGVEIRFDGSTTLFLYGYNKANLMASNFDFA